MVWNKKKKIYFKIFIIFFLVFLTIIFFLIKAATSGDPLNKIKINDKIIKVEIASSPWRQYFGLSNRDSLCLDCGMLFIFPDKQEREFVMRNMNFSLDIIFIADGRIVSISEKLEPEGSQPVNSYKSLVPVDMVLEVSGGYSQRHGIKINDQIVSYD